MLKQIRVVLALLIFAGLTFFFIDFTDFAPQKLHGIAHLQLIPALLSFHFAIFGALLLLTFIFGRIYCSVLCPLGITQDFFNWCYKLFNRKNKKELYNHYKYRKENKVLRYTALAVFALLLIFGLGTIAGLAEPYSIFGRIASDILRPVYVAGNNILAGFLPSLYRVDFETVTRSLFSIGAAAVSFAVIGWLSYRYGRLYCNSFCPVGTGLGLVSRFSLLKIRVNEAKCNRCGICEHNCKGGCMEVSKKDGVKFDSSRCVACYNCMEKCPKGALSYSLPKKQVEKAEDIKPDEGRKNFIAMLFLAIPLVSAAQKRHGKMQQGTGGLVAYTRETPLSPPGSISHKHLLSKCTGCHMCVSKCPSDVLKPAFMEYGAAGMMAPVMSFEKGFCSFDCVVCTDVCPSKAISRLTIEEKHVAQPGKVVLILDNCIVKRNHESCGACSEHCPTQAVSMVPYEDGLTIPKIDPSLCVGCGGCEYVCPVRPYRAIHIEGEKVHGQATPFKEAEKIELDLDGFGF